MSGLLIDNPIDLLSLLRSDRVIPGDNILLRAGTYTGNFTVPFQGTESNRITIRPYPGETAIIEGSLTIGDATGDEGSYVDIRGLQIQQTPEYRGQMTDPEGVLALHTTVEVMAHHVRLINNIIHDGGIGIGHWTSAPGSVIYGNVVYNNGWANLGGAGQSIYIQNLIAGEAKTIKHNIFGPAFKRAMAVYATNGENGNMSFLENVIFGYTPELIGGQMRMDDITFSGNHLLSNIQTFYTHHQNGSIVFDDNIIRHDGYAASLLMGYWESIEMLRNTIIGKNNDADVVIQEIIGLTQPDDPTGFSVNINNNEYHISEYAQFAQPFKVDGNYKTFAQWQALGYDAAGMYDEIETIPDQAFVYANEYLDADDPRMGIVVIWNGSAAESVSVDLSSLNLTNGTYRWRQAQDPLTDTGTFEYSGAAVDFPMTGHTVAVPTAWDVALVSSQFPTFGAFVIEAA
jgi:hypothetical protein